MKSRFNSSFVLYQLLVVHLNLATYMIIELTALSKVYILK